MKNRILKYCMVLCAFLIAIGCSEDDKLVESVISDVGRGAILRTIAVPSPTFDFNDQSSQWVVTLEEQDAEDGGLLTEVEVFVQLISAGGDSSEELIRTIAASEFSSGPLGLPRIDLGLTLSDVLGTLGLQTGDFASDDQFNIRLNVKLSTGQAFTSGDANPNVSGGQFFSSPYSYRAQFFCALDDASLFDGAYRVVTDAWADYQAGDVIPVEQVPNSFTFRILSTANPFINNTDTAYIEVTINPEDGTVVASSNEPFDYGVPVDVIGSGSVGTCTGDINLVLDFVGQATDQGFTLVKN